MRVKGGTCYVLKKRNNKRVIRDSMMKNSTETLTFAFKIIPSSTPMRKKPKGNADNDKKMEKQNGKQKAERTCDVSSPAWRRQPGVGTLQTGGLCSTQCLRSCPGSSGVNPAGRKGLLLAPAYLVKASQGFLVWAPQNLSPPQFLYPNPSEQPVQLFRTVIFPRGSFVFKHQYNFQLEAEYLYCFFYHK